MKTSEIALLVGVAALAVALGVTAGSPPHGTVLKSDGTKEFWRIEKIEKAYLAQMSSDGTSFVTLLVPNTSIDWVFPSIDSAQATLESHLAGMGYTDFETE